MIFDLITKLYYYILPLNWYPENYINTEFSGYCLNCNKCTDDIIKLIIHETIENQSFYADCLTMTYFDTKQSEIIDKIIKDADYVLEYIEVNKNNKVKLKHVTNTIITILGNLAYASKYCRCPLDYDLIDCTYKMFIIQLKLIFT